MSDIPRGRFRRGGHLARAALKVGTNYAQHALKKGLGGDAKTLRSDLNRRNAEDLFKEFSKMRGTVLKLAQTIGCDTGLLPEEFSEVMSQAQSRVPPMSRPLILKRLTHELGASPHEIFAEFDETAVAAASLGQVHRARLHDGRPVAVKIQYPDVRDAIDSDLEMSRPLVERYLGHAIPDHHHNEVRERLLEETDYLQEGAQLEVFADIYATPGIVTPRWIREFSTSQVLTMTWIDGRRFDDWLAGAPSQESRNAFGQKIWDLFHDQVHRQQTRFHADIHPGNYLFCDDGTLGIVDFGCVKTFPVEFLRTFLSMFVAQVDRDDTRIRSLYESADLLDPAKQGDPREEDTFRYLLEFGRIVVEPYITSPFDFSEPGFRGRFNTMLRRGIDYSHVTGSEHFIFMDRILFGMLALLRQLGAHVDTTASQDIIRRVASR